MIWTIAALVLGFLLGVFFGCRDPQDAEEEEAAVKMDEVKTSVEDLD